MGGDRDVCGQSPRRGGPHQQGGVGVVHQGQADVNRGVFGFFVAEGDLMVGKGRAAARAVGHDFVPAVNQPLFPKLLQNPPFAFNVFVVVGDVSVLKVNPKGNALSKFFPILDVFKDGLAAEFVELGDAEFLNLAFAGEAEFFLNFNFHRQAVSIPAAAADDVIAAHDPVAQEDVLERARKDVVHAGASVGGRRAFVKDKFGAAAARLLGFVENVVLFPKFQVPLFHFGERYLRRNWFEG